MAAERVGLEEGNAPRESWAWVVRGEPGGGESQGGSSWVGYNLDNNVVTLGWGDRVCDAPVTAFEDREMLKRSIERYHQDNRERKWPEPEKETALSSVWRFCNEINVGDLVVLPPKGEKWIAIGEVTGLAERDTDRRPGTQLYRPVRWLATRKSRVVVPGDLLRSINSEGTIFRIGGDDDSRRINFCRALQDLV